MSEKCLGTGNSSRLHVSANRADGLPSWNIMRPRTIWFTRKALGRISVLIRAVKTEIPAKLRHPEAAFFSLAVRTGIFVFLLSIALFSQVERAGGVGSQDGNSRQARQPGVAASATSSTGRHCETTGTGEITISCTYTARSAAGSVEGATPRVVLDHAVISFAVWHESHMHVELEFTKDSGRKIMEQRAVYLAIDDPEGQNHMRRPLPQVDFTKLDPGKPSKFEETLLAPAFRPGAYTISLWVPSNDPAVKFDPMHNFLLSSEDVPDSKTGLNRIATFVATAAPRRKPTELPD